MAQIVDDVGQLTDAVALALFDPEEFGQLADGDEDGQAEYKAVHHRSRQEGRDESELQQTGRHEHGPGDDDEPRGDHHVLMGIGGVKGGDGRVDEDRRGRGPGHHQLAAGAEEGVQTQRGHQGVQAGLGRQSGQAGVGDHLRDQQPPDGRPGDGVQGPLRPAVLRQPAQDGHETCDPLDRDLSPEPRSLALTRAMPVHDQKPSPFSSRLVSQPVVAGR